MAWSELPRAVDWEKRTRSVDGKALHLDLVLEQRWTMTQPVCGLLDAYFYLLPHEDESTKPAYRCRRLFATVFWMPDTFFPEASSAHVLSDPFSEKSLCLVAQWQTCYFKYVQSLLDAYVGELEE
ncbi:hypothetical protein HPB50_027792 [Hyalomma asiaticum]|nr:hypothetical protein HPB50_027792 [Hyalomma asiaticum]